MLTMITNDRSLEVLIEELKVLIQEIEKNPGISSWTIRMAIKALVEKAEKKMKETA